MSRRPAAIIVLVGALALTGCVHQSPFTGESGYFFQAMGRDSEIVLTADTGRVKEEMPSLLTTGSSVMDELFDRSTRVSIAFYKDVYGGEADYPADLADFDYYGGLDTTEVSRATTAPSRSTRPLPGPASSTRRRSTA